MKEKLAGSPGASLGPQVPRCGTCLARIDKLLMALEVRGDSVMILAEARMLLGEVYSGVKCESGGETT